MCSSVGFADPHHVSLFTDMLLGGFNLSRMNRVRCSTPVEISWWHHGWALKAYKIKRFDEIRTYPLYKSQHGVRLVDDKFRKCEHSIDYESKITDLLNTLKGQVTQNWVMFPVEWDCFTLRYVQKDFVITTLHPQERRISFRKSVLSSGESTIRNILISSANSRHVNLLTPYYIYMLEPNSSTKQIV